MNFRLISLHKKPAQLYRVNKINTDADGSSTPTAETSGMMGPTIVGEFPEVEKLVRYQPWYNNVVLSNKDRNIEIGEAEAVFADSTFSMCSASP